MHTYLNDLAAQLVPFLAGSGAGDTISDLLLKDPNVAAMKEGIGLVTGLMGVSSLVDQLMPYILSGLAAMMVLGLVSNQPQKTTTPPENKPTEPPKT